MNRTAIALALALAAGASAQAGTLPPIVTLVDGGILLEFEVGQPLGAAAQPAGTATCGGELPPESAGRRATRGQVPTGLRLTKFCTGSVDHLFEHLFYLRTSAEPSEVVWPEPNAVSVNGNTATFSWQQFQTRSFDAELSVTVTDTSGGAGTAGTATFTFTTIAPFRAADGVAMLHGFPYFDLCLDDACEGMSAELVVPNNEIRISTGASDTEVVIRQIGNAAYAVDAYPGILGLLQDGAADTFANTGLPFGPGDFTGAFEVAFPAPQVTRSVEGNVSAISWEIAISNATVPVELMQFQVD